MHLRVFSLVFLLAAFSYADTTVNTNEAAQVIEEAEKAVGQEADVKKALKHTSQEDDSDEQISGSMDFSDMSSEWQDESNMSEFGSSFWSDSRDL